MGHVHRIDRGIGPGDGRPLKDAPSIGPRLCPRALTLFRFRSLPLLASLFISSISAAPNDDNNSNNNIFPQQR